MPDGGRVRAELLLEERTLWEEMKATHPNYGAPSDMTMSIFADMSELLEREMRYCG